jgi:endogenous inhibitor of DNA gyrase (YacG/DUF329 family)
MTQQEQKHCGNCNEPIIDNVTQHWDEGTPFCSASCLDWHLRYQHHNAPKINSQVSDGDAAYQGTCLNCGNKYNKIHANDRFCSTSCKNQFLEEERGEELWEATRE